MRTYTFAPPGANLCARLEQNKKGRDLVVGDVHGHFATLLDRVVERYQPALWIHGHMHDPVDERLGRTRLIANPAGYAYEEKAGFDPAFCVDLDPTLPCDT